MVENKSSVFDGMMLMRWIISCLVIQVRFSKFEEPKF